MISNLCTENIVVLTVTSLLRVKTSGKSWICGKQRY